MKVALLGKNKLCLVDGSTSKADFGPALAHQWDCFNVIVTSWLMSNEQYAQILQLLNKTSIGETNSNIAAMEGKFLCCNVQIPKWIIDTGDTNHMIGSDKFLSNGISVGNKGQVQMPTGDSSKVTHIGDCQLTIGDTIKNVLCDLLSERVNEIGKEEEGLYTMLSTTRNNASKIYQAFAAITEEPGNTGDIWHKRMGHVPMEVLRKISSFSSSILSNKCEVCPLARQTRVPFPKGYKLLDLKHNILFTSRDVIFYEEAFPFQNPEVETDQQFLDIHDLSSQAVVEEPIPPCSAHIPPCSPPSSQSISSLEPDSSSTSNLFDSIIAPTHTNEGIIQAILQVPYVPLPAEVRTTTRESRPLIWLKDFVRTDKVKQSNCCQYPISIVIGYDNLSPKYQSYLSNFSPEVEPANYYEAAKDKRWVEAMQTEIKALKDNKTWELVPFPKGKKAIGCK
ncbi:uncharacterized protein LOC142173696 [Nicotiana tabacum]|uniref:Uncharacterized protein LOC142173696 n=1 Tax=Nicotiana tabacum TaxID=4097 RepID=A0AC58TE03_TOBAC